MFIYMIPNTTFIFNRCHRIWPEVSPVKYERNSKKSYKHYVTSEISFTEKLTDGFLEIPATHQFGDETNVVIRIQYARVFLFFYCVMRVTFLNGLKIFIDLYYPGLLHWLCPNHVIEPKVDVIWKMWTNWSVPHQTNTRHKARMCIVLGMHWINIQGKYHTGLELKPIRSFETITQALVAVASLMHDAFKWFSPFW